MDGGNGLVKESAAQQPAELQPAVVVTGASSGIGRALAIQAGTGRHVLLVARSAEPMRLIAADIVAKGGSASFLPFDITDASAAETIAARLAEEGRYCDVLVNNAGYGLIGKAEKLDAGEQLGIVDLNVRALAKLSLAFLPGMLERGRGGILNVASVAAFAPGPGMAMYYASKAFVRSLSLALWQETKGSGVTVTTLCPGPVSTGFFSRATGGAKKPSLFKLLPGTTADQVAEAGWKAFRAGHRQVIPGWTNWLTVRIVQILPLSVRLWLIARLQAARQRKA
ncbi:MAG: SDR family oxidoreductase [Methylocystis sp.]|nr:SDR family oxidoreductase [Methylocystis sp.]MCA3582071.1 SDR family oxidoreductase [Methylocystis sp.]MCA3586703.1 SDR family oxidoreductase [Methylocystis sp.]MCA3590952.1 SDR family oxidoreductase [Methylocystis sp.]